MLFPEYDRSSFTPIQNRKFIVIAGYYGSKAKTQKFLFGIQPNVGSERKNADAYARGTLSFYTNWNAELKIRIIMIRDLVVGYLITL
jgi:hypothetical protein